MHHAITVITALFEQFHRSALYLEKKIVTRPKGALLRMSKIATFPKEYLHWRGALIKAYEQ